MAVPRDGSAGLRQCRATLLTTTMPRFRRADRRGAAFPAVVPRLFRAPLSRERPGHLSRISALWFVSDSTFSSCGTYIFTHFLSMYVYKRKFLKNNIYILNFLSP
jgi:hypothetical protein